MFRATISLPDEMGEYLDKSGNKTSETIQDLIFDYRYACLYAEYKKDVFLHGMKAEEKQQLEKYLDEEIFKLKRLFDKDNHISDDEEYEYQHGVGMVAVVIMNDYMFTRKTGIFCIEQFIELNSFFRMRYRGRQFLIKCLCERMIEDYLDEDEIVKLKPYHSYFLEADKLELKIKKDEIQEIFMYKDGQLVDYALGDDMRLSTYKSKVERLTNAEWVVTDKKEGSPDCSLVRKK